MVLALGLLRSEARAAERRGVEVAVEAGAVARGGGGEVGRGAAAADAVVGRLPGVGGPVSFLADELASEFLNKTFVENVLRTAGRQAGCHNRLGEAGLLLVSAVEVHDVLLLHCFGELPSGRLVYRN